MPLIRFPTVKGLVYTIDLSKIADRANPRTVEAPLYDQWQGDVFVDWGDGNVEKLTSAGGAHQTHTYSGTENIFTVTIRNYNGHFPFIRFNTGDTYNVAPTANLSYAVVSVDHFNGTIGSSNPTGGNMLLRNCKNCTYIDTRLAGSSKWQNFDYAFAAHSVVGGESSLAQPIESFCFSFASGLQYIRNTFVNCKHITGSIPETLFSNNTLCFSFAYVFANCFGLTGTIPAKLFKYNTLSTSFDNSFYGCSGLTGSIPAELFKYNTVATVFSSCFNGCSGITAVEPGLFDSVVNATGFNAVFGGTGITAIPDGLFKNNSLADTFNSCFMNCTELETIGTGAFDGCISALNLGYVFYGCSKLQSLPADLFEDCTGVTNFNQAFRNCSSLAPPPVPFWDSTKWTASPTHDRTFSGCPEDFLQYVPQDWGGTMTV